MNELWDLYDENRRVLGKTIRRGDTVPPGTYHILVAVWTVNSSGQLLITRRSPEKFYCPNCWENTGGAVLSGETSRQAAARELREETGIDVSPEDFFLLTTTKEKRFFTDTYLLFTDIPLEQLRMQPGETVEARWAKLEEIEQLGKQGAFVPIALSQLAPVRERFERLISSRGRCEEALLQID